MGTSDVLKHDIKIYTQNYKLNTLTWHDGRARPEDFPPERDINSNTESSVTYLTTLFLTRFLGIAWLEPYYASAPEYFVIKAF